MSDTISLLKELLISAQNSIKTVDLINKLPDLAISDTQFEKDYTEKEDIFVYNCF